MLIRGQPSTFITDEFIINLEVDTYVPVHNSLACKFYNYDTVLRVTLLCLLCNIAGQKITQLSLISYGTLIH